MDHFKPHVYILAIVLMGIAAVPALGSGSVQVDVNKQLFSAIRDADLDKMTSLIVHGADINQANAQGYTPLMEAARTGDHRVLEQLLSQDAEVDAQNDAGATALMIAAKYGHTHTIQQLLDHGADPGIINNYGNKASDFAKAYKKRDAYRALLKAEREFGNL